MPDKRVTELTAIDAVTDTDLVMVIDDPAGTPVNKKATVTQVLVNTAKTNVSNVFTGDQTVDGDLFVTGEVNPTVFARQKPKIDRFTGTVGDPAGSRTLMSQSLVSGLSLRHDEALGQGRLSVGNYDTQSYQPLLFEVESFQVHTGVSPGTRVERLRVHPSGGVTVGANHTTDPGVGSVLAATFDLKEGIPINPPPDTGRLYALDVNGYTQIEMRDANAKVVRFASDNVLIAKVSGAAITRGQALYIAGAAGANPLVGLARADAMATMPCVGIALDSGVVNAFIRVLLLGTFQLLNTAAFAEGDRLYVSPMTAGALTSTRPVEPNFVQRVGIVTRSHATQGEMLVLTTAVESASAALPTNLVYTDVANTFTEDQLINKAVPRLVLQNIGASKSRFLSAQATDLWFSRNADFNSGDQSWYRDDLTKTASLVGLNAAGDMAYYVAAAGSNPAALTERLMIRYNGDTTVSGLLTVNTANARLDLRDTSGSADSKLWRIESSYGALSIYPCSDAGVAQSTAVNFYRGGSTEWYAPVKYYEAATYYGLVTMSGSASVGGNLTVSGTATVSGRQLITGGSGTSYSTAPLEIQAATSRIAFHWPGVVASQIGVGTDGTIRTYDNPGTGYAPFAAQTIQSITNQWISNIHSSGYMYPGAMTAPAGIQSTWYIAGHSSYGLYSNTGLYIESHLWANQGIFRSAVSCNYVEATAHIRAATGLYDYARGLPIGDWTNNPGYWGGYFQSGFFYYSLVGHTLHLHAYAYLWMGGTPANFTCSHPFVSSQATQIPVMINSNSAWVVAFMTTSAGGSSLVFQKVSGAGNFTSGIYIGLNCAIAVN